MTEPVYRRTTCRLCGSDLSLGLDLADTPLGDDFVSAERLGEVQPMYSLDLALCEVCGHTQLVDVVNPEVIYEDYVYTTSVSLGLPEHFARYADDVIERVKPQADGLVVEIGSNEGALLRAFKARGMRVLGVDPAKEIARQATENGTETLGAYFDGALASQLRGERGPAAVVTANNVYANIDDLEDMTLGIRSLLAPEGVFVFETSYFLDVVQKALLDTVFHEHLSYFSVAPMRAFFERLGMELIDVRRVDTKGGSIRGTVQLAGGPHAVSPSVDALVAEERSVGIHTRDGLAALGRRLDEIGRELRAVLDDVKARGATVAGYGAAVGLTTIIYQFDLGGSLEFIADDNPAKQGMYSPGYHIPVLPSDVLYERDPDYVVVLAWRYVDAIVEKHRAYLDAGGHFIVPLPAVEVR